MSLTPRPTADYITSYTEDVRLIPGHTALVVIDMQYASGSRTLGLGKRLAEEGREEIGRERFERIDHVVVPNLQRLLAFCRGDGIPVVYLVVGSNHPEFLDAPPVTRRLFRDTNNRVGNREHEVLDEVKPRPGELVLRKATVSGFTSTGLDSVLRAMGADVILFAGISTNMCVDTTARDAADRGYACVLVEDCCGAAKMSYHDAALITFQRLFGRVASTDEMITEYRAALGATA